ncbi:MAG: hypothetical protein CVV44_17820 [Spirochaetae bacterium HGW-Spirochaetae-1]|nr:MAG: hypothetical protein CVV44_17820 [Spirochaetae bacterium HGW-Spirochaetae-1]
MKKIWCIMTFLFLAGALQAQETDLLKKKGEKEKSGISRNLSIGFSFNLAPDLAGLGETIIDDGVLDLNEDSLAANTNTSYLIVSDKDNAIYYNASDGTSQDLFKFVGGYSEGGPMIGVGLSGTLIWDMNNATGLPLFIRGGFDYIIQFMGGHQKRILGPGVDSFLTYYNGTNDEQFPHDGNLAGGTLDTTFTSSWYEIPVTFGFMTTLYDKAKIYGGMGVGYISGGWSLRMKADDRYVQYITSYAGQDALLCRGAIDETVKFRLRAMSFNFVIGFEFFLTDRMVGSFEFMGTGTAGTVYAEAEFSERGAQILTTALGGASVATLDNQYLKRFAYPVLLGTSAFRMGMRYYIF